MGFYIREEDTKTREIAYYGPFEESEIHERLNDAFADLMASGLANLNSFEMTDKEAECHYINPRAFWMEQLASLTKDTNA